MPILTLFDQPEISLSVPRNINGGQESLDKHRNHFEGQTKWVYEQMLTGRKISGLIAFNEFGIQDVRARIYTLKKSGIEIKSNTIKGANGAKEYYLNL